MKLKLAAVIVLGVVGAVAIIVSLGGFGSAAATTTQYLTSPAAIGDVTDDIAATGSVEPATRTAVAFGVTPWSADDASTPAASPATYPVIEVSVSVGDVVATGDVLATADTSAMERDLARARNDLSSARVSLRAAESDLSDADDNGTTAQIRQAKVSRYNALNQVDQAEQAVEDLKAQIAGATLTAPGDGLVTEVAIVAGADAPSGSALVIDSTTFQITTDVVESDLASVKIGQPALVTVSAVDAVITGTVSAIAPTADASGNSSVVSFPVTVTLSDAPTTLRSGMTADVTITVASAADVLTVPSAALVGRDGNYSVRTLGADGTPVATPVQVGLVTNTTAEISSGLAEGTAVITGTASDLLGATSNGGFGGAFPGGGAIGVGGGRFQGGQVRQGNGN
jgi:RND family efflux transporter MFP subunit